MAEHDQYESFEDVEVLGVEERRSLLASSDPVERLWAAWSLGLELGRDATPHLVASLKGEPSDGMRRQLLVVLAGLGEHELLRAFAQSDPDEYVRATAIQYFVRTNPDQLSAIRFAADRLLSDAARVVRRAVLQEIGNELAGVDGDQLEALATDADPDVRRLAVRALASRIPAGGLLPALRERCARSGIDFAAREYIAGLCIEAGFAHQVLAVAVTSDPRTGSRLLDQLLYREKRFQWEALAPLTRIGSPDIDWKALSLLDSRDLEHAFGQMLLYIGRAAKVADRCSTLAEHRIHDLLESGRPVVVRDKDRPALLAAISSLEGRQHTAMMLVHSDDRWDEGDDEEWDDDRYEQGSWSLLDELKRLAGTGEA